MKSGWAAEFRLLLIRHGETASNRRGVFLGHQDEALNTTGREQAARLAERLEEMGVDTIYSSPLQRALSTAEIIGAKLGKRPRVDVRLIEQDFGEWDGLTLDEARIGFPDNFRSWWADGNMYAPSKGENLESLGSRILAFYNHLRVVTKTETCIVIVGHASAFQALLCRLLSIPTRSQWPFRLQVGTLSEVQFIHSQPSLTRLSWI